MVHRHPAHHHRLLTGRSLHRHGDGVVPVHEAPDHRDEGDDGGDGHVAVQGPRAVELGQVRRQPATDDHQFEAGLAGQLDHAGVGVHREEPRVEIGEGGDQDHRVLAAADGDEQPAGAAERLRRRGPAVRASGSDGDGTRHGQAVGHREFAQTVVVEPALELGLDRGEPCSFHHHRRWRRRLVVAGPGGDVQVEEGPFEPRPGRRSAGRHRLEGDGLLELRTGVEPVAQGQCPRRPVEDPLGDPERAHSGRVEAWEVAHGEMSVAVRSPSLSPRLPPRAGGCAR